MTDRTVQETVQRERRNMLTLQTYNTVKNYFYYNTQSFRIHNIDGNVIASFSGAATQCNKEWVQEHLKEIGGNLFSVTNKELDQLSDPQLRRSNVR